MIMIQYIVIAIFSLLCSTTYSQITFSTSLVNIAADLYNIRLIPNVVNNTLPVLDYVIIHYTIDYQAVQQNQPMIYSTATQSYELRNGIVVPNNQSITWSFTYKLHGNNIQYDTDQYTSQSGFTKPGYGADIIGRS